MFSVVVKGNVLGPTLCIIYINDLFDVCKDMNEIKLFLFADDVKIYKSVSSVSDRNILQTGLNKMVEWCFDNDFVVNVNKCVWMTIGRDNEDAVAYTK